MLKGEVAGGTTPRTLSKPQKFGGDVTYCRDPEQTKLKGKGPVRARGRYPAKEQEQNKDCGVRVTLQD